MQGDSLNKKTWMDYLLAKAKDPSSLFTHMKFVHLKARSQFENPSSERYPDIEIECDRTQPWYSSVGDLLRYNGREFATLPLNVNFLNEEGVDMGALSQEWLTLALKTITNPEIGLFEYSDNKVGLQISEKAFLVNDYQMHLRLVGRLIAKALIEGYDI